MGRIGRVVLAGCWHHVTQRGNRQLRVFTDDVEWRLYLELLEEHCLRHRVRLAGYCLMPNHVHLAAAPETPAGLSAALGRAHNDYARWWNLRHSQVGHLWQNRFYSCPMDDGHTWEALRYIELNPVRAAIVGRAIDWPWSSASAHLLGHDESGLLDMTDWRARWSPGTWEQVLVAGVNDTVSWERLREATRTGRPAGNEEFLKTLESATGRSLRARKRGPKPRSASAGGQMSFEVV